MSRRVQGPAATPNLRHLVLFDEVVRRGSVSAAARAAHLSQPAVTQAVRAGRGGPGRAPHAAQLRRAGAHRRPARAAAQRIERALQMLREALSAVRPRVPGAQEDEVLRGITSTQLQALMAVVEAGAFARAARRIGRARAAVHRAARQLEKSLGTELFEVTSHGVRPTREAEKLAAAHAAGVCRDRAGPGRGGRRAWHRQRRHGDRGDAAGAQRAGGARGARVRRPCGPSTGSLSWTGLTRACSAPCAAAPPTCWSAPCVIPSRTRTSCRNTCSRTRWRSWWGLAHPLAGGGAPTLAALARFSVDRAAARLAAAAALRCAAGAPRRAAGGGADRVQLADRGTLDAAGQ